MLVYAGANVRLNYTVLLCLVLLSLVHRVVLKEHIFSGRHGHGSSKSTFKIAKPSITQAKWLDFEVGASIHFNMQTFDKSMKRGVLNFLASLLK